MKNANVSLPILVTNEQFELLNYLATLQGRELRDFAIEVVEEFLERNYTMIAEEFEPKHGLPSSIILTRTGRFSKRAYQAMEENFDKLCGALRNAANIEGRA